MFCVKLPGVAKKVDLRLYFNRMYRQPCVGKVALWVACPQGKRGLCSTARDPCTPHDGEDPLVPGIFENMLAARA